MQTDDRKTLTETYCLLELMGHQKVAGLLTETTIAGKGMLRVDIPNEKGQTIHTRFYSPDAVYSISPVDRQICIGIAVKCNVRPVTIYDLAKLIEDKKPGQGEEVLEEPPFVE